MADLHQYSPSDVVMSWNGIDIDGLAADTFVEVTRNVDTFLYVAGAKGSGTRVQSEDRSGRVVFRLQQSSLTNALLSAQMRADELTGTVTGSFLLKHVLGTTLVQAEAAWLMRPANVLYGTTLQTREWTIEAQTLDVIVGGSAPINQ